MVREQGPPAGEEDERRELPDGTEHVIVAVERGIRINVPEGYEPADDTVDRLTLELGDALPADAARDCFNSFGDSVLAIDADDEPLAVPGDAPSERVEYVIKEWRTDGFDPNEYDSAAD